MLPLPLFSPRKRIHAVAEHQINHHQWTPEERIPSLWAQFYHVSTRFKSANDLNESVTPPVNQCSQLICCWLTRQDEIIPQRFGASVQLTVSWRTMRRSTPLQTRLYVQPRAQSPHKKRHPTSRGEHLSSKFYERVIRADGFCFVNQSCRDGRLDSCQGSVCSAKGPSELSPRHNWLLLEGVEKLSFHSAFPQPWQMSLSHLQKNTHKRAQSWFSDRRLKTPVELSNVFSWGQNFRWSPGAAVVVDLLKIWNAGEMFLWSSPDLQAHLSCDPSVARA